MKTLREAIRSRRADAAATSDPVVMAQPTEPLVMAPPTEASGYQPGVCNIGPAEIARRRRSGHIGLGTSVALAAGLALVDAPPVTRLVVALPAAVAASGYLQARLHFCSGFGSVGVFNFGPAGATQQVDDPEARRLDRKRSSQITAASIGIGVMAGVLAAAIPLTRR